MPVTFHPAKHPVNKVRVSWNDLSANQTPLAFLQEACNDQYRKCKELLQSSWETSLSPSPSNDSGRSFDEVPDPPKDLLVPIQNGFVETVRRAYSEHHALSIRPDDIWICILTQFNSFVNANAEALRSLFVHHKGKKGLLVFVPVGNRYTVDWGYISNLMAEGIRNNVKDPSLADEWIKPNFSTTTENDVVILLGCGLPSVTLEGEKSDYEELLERIDRLDRIAEELDSKSLEQAKQLKRWAAYLRPVLRRFVRAFDDPEGEENLEFWQRVAHAVGGGSSTPYFSGWITAFCVFSSDGKWIGGELEEPDELPSAVKTYPSSFGPDHKIPTIVLDGITFPVNHSIPYGYASVPVLMNDNGVEEEAIMVAGLMGMKVVDGMSVKPQPGWCIFTKKEPDDNYLY
ncbi:hypothetical protein K435DRAFT_960179 [Dendrothele bispora CBS 962.96]|uniref:Uncharacterized protein n=1 Tax=Dendrothele bispora (strain CBS 962.96) TaxID=1314807 RepID=A0A4S8MUK1_DENBC|nr:hypothetical protein K435DRAFT_960179 [Dendrothele bispora CBS 962.96]